MLMKIQKILMFIPVINIITVFIWIFMSFKYKETAKSNYATSFKMALAAILVNIPRMILSLVFKNDTLDMIAFWVSAYILFFLISLIAVKAQEKLLEKDKEQVEETDNSPGSK